jgi:hypothetical protein
MRKIKLKKVKGKGRVGNGFQVCWKLNKGAGRHRDLPLLLQAITRVD